jgi:hypothetical protein
MSDKYQALRDALKAGPTDGPWNVIEHSWLDASIIAPGFVHGICCLDINHATEESQDADGALMSANAAYIAAANPSTITALLADLDAAEKDAQRYRWLRNESWAGYNQSKRLPEVAESVVITRDGAGNVKTILAEDAMDAAIDAALSQLKGD